jgi:protein-L-isoaspartate(D-aspartate) O-methyltransferase
MSSPAPSSAALRQQMIELQIAARGISDPLVLQALQAVPREVFLPGFSLEEAYADQAKPIACAQTISQPYIVAVMTAALKLRGGERVLEIGTGSGYQAAVLAQIAGQVVSIERHAELSVIAAQRFRSLGISNVDCHVGDGTLGWPAMAPYVGILVTAGAGRVPPALFDQLAEGGRLVMPVGVPEDQMLQVFQRQQGEYIRTNLTPCRFVPLIGGETEAN